MGCRLPVFCFHSLVLFCMCWHAHSFSHNWLCQRFTNANKRLFSIVSLACVFGPVGARGVILLINGTLSLGLHGTTASRRQNFLNFELQSSKASLRQRERARKATRERALSGPTSITGGLGRRPHHGLRITTRFSASPPTMVE